MEPIDYSKQKDIILNSCNGRPLFAVEMIHDSVDSKVQEPIFNLPNIISPQKGVIKACEDIFISKETEIETGEIIRRLFNTKQLNEELYDNLNWVLLYSKFQGINANLSSIQYNRITNDRADYFKQILHIIESLDSKSMIKGISFDIGNKNSYIADKGFKEQFNRIALESFVEAFYHSTQKERSQLSILSKSWNHLKFDSTYSDSNEWISAIRKLDDIILSSANDISKKIYIYFDIYSNRHCVKFTKAQIFRFIGYALCFSFHKEFKDYYLGTPEGFDKNAITYQDLNWKKLYSYTYKKTNPNK